MRRNKVITADAAAELVLAGDTMATTGFVGTGFPEELALALERRFLDTGEPRDLTLVFAAGQGDGATRGVNHFAHEGMLRRVIGGHWALVPALGAPALGNRIEAYCSPPMPRFTIALGLSARVPRRAMALRGPEGA